VLNYLNALVLGLGVSDPNKVNCFSFEIVYVLCIKLIKILVEIIIVYYTLI